MTKIYHYTSIEALYYILSTKTFRFTSLGKVDDITEVESKGIENIGNFWYVSCWTNKQEESIPQWHMYSNSLKGVRIGIPDHLKEIEYIFALTQIDGEKMGFPNNTIFITKPKEEEYEGLRTKKIGLSIPTHPVLKEIIYTDDPELLRPNMILDSQPSKFKNTENIGCYKPSAWDFQSEVRFMLKLWPFEFSDIKEKKQDNLSNFIIDSFNSKINLLPDNIHLPLNEHFLKSIEILLAPNCDKYDQWIVETMVNEFIGSSKKVQKSKLKIRQK